MKILPAQNPCCKTLITGIWEVITAHTPLANPGIARGQALRTA